jgi:hypothetical protein
MEQTFKTPQRNNIKMKCPDAPPRKRAKVVRETGSEAFKCPAPIKSPKITTEEENEILRESPYVLNNVSYCQISPIAGDLTPCFRDGEYSDDE